MEIQSFPPEDLGRCIGIICNGEIEISTALEQNLKKCLAVIGVDGGLNHCKEMGISPACIVGDFDSVDPQILEEYKKKRSCNGASSS